MAIGSRRIQRSRDTRHTVNTRRPRTARASAIAEEHDRIAKAAVVTPSTDGEAPAPSVIKAVPFQIGPVQPVGERAINALIYGPYGHGKTTFVATADDVPEMRDVLFIDAESGSMSLTSRKSLDIIKINKYDQLARIYDYLVLHCMWRDRGDVEKLLEYEKKFKSVVIDVKYQTPPVEEGRTWFVEQRLRTGRSMDEPYLYRTVILDSLSEMHKYLVYKFTGVDIGKTKLDEEIERMEEWQPAQELFRLLVRSFRDLPMSFLAVSAEDLREERKRGVRSSQMLPKLAGQMAGDVAGFIDIVGYLQREIGKDGEANRYLYLGAGYEGWISKHRFDNLPDLDFVTNPTLSSLMDLARKDAEANGTSTTRPVTARSTVPSPSNTSGPTATNGSSPAVASSGRRGDNSVRRRRRAGA